MIQNYDDILSHPRYRLQHHTPMSIQARAAQFSSFKALNGFEAEIAETARETDVQRECSEDRVDQLNRGLHFLLQHEYENIAVRLVYWKSDCKKSGGAYVAYSGKFKYWNLETRQLVFTDGFAVEIERIWDLQLDTFT